MTTEEHNKIIDLAWQNPSRESLRAAGQVLEMYEAEKNRRFQWILVRRCVSWVCLTAIVISLIWKVL